ncbi:MAG: GMC oxidoreductase [Gammaproteobacteria bacterium]
MSGSGQARSRGYLRLKSANPRDPVEINANMLGDPRDLAALRKGMESAVTSATHKR